MDVIAEIRELLELAAQHDDVTPRCAVCSHGFPSHFTPPARALASVRKP